MIPLAWRTRCHRARSSRAYRPATEPLEGRALLTGTVLIDDSTPAYYNDNIGHKLDDTGQPQFPTVGDPTLDPAPEPDLSAPAVAAVLGEWLESTPAFNGNWSGPRAIPTTWPISTENAVVYPITVAPGNVLKLTGNFGVDNGIFVWVDGRYRFGALAPGGFGAYDYTNIDLGTVGSGTHYLQIIREDHGTLDGSTIQVLGESSTTLPGTIQLSDATYGVSEDAGGASITVTRQGGSAGQVSVTLTPTDGTAHAPDDFNGTPVVVTFDDGDAVPKTVRIPIVADALVEGDETIHLTLSGPTGGATLGAPAAAVLTVHDVPPPPAGTIRFSRTVYDVRETDGRAAIVVTRVGGTAGALSVAFVARDGTARLGEDYALNARAITVTFADGDAAPKLVFVPIVDDTKVEGNETVKLALIGPAAGTPAVATLTIHDRPVPIRRPTPHFLVREFRVRENGLRAQITVVLDHAWNRPLTITYATRQLAAHPRRGQATQGKDYLRATGSLTFAPGRKVLSFFVRLKDDNLTEGNEKLGLSLRDPATGRVQSASLIIVDARRPRKVVRGR